MTINRVNIYCFRNIHDCSIEFGKDINFIYGVNASGKTSLLEALFCLARFRSFRINNKQKLISHEATEFSLFTQLNNNISIGISHHKNNTAKIHINSQSCESSYELSRKIVLQAITPDNYNLLDCSPENRRKYIDWSVFHVKHELFPFWKRYKKILAQRNKAIKIHLPKQQILIWDEEFSKLTIKFLNERKTVIERINQKLLTYQQIISLPVQLEFKPGWDQSIDYIEALQYNFERDLKYGYTGDGLHRSDLIIKATENGKNYLAKEVLSNGNKKLLSILLIIIQLELFIEESKYIKPVLLIDDLFSEVDQTNLEKIISILEKLPIQIFITSISRDNNKYFEQEKIKMFHVKHGNVIPQN